MTEAPEARDTADATVDRRHERGPFDIIGDVHGCRDELIELLGQLGYAVAIEGSGDSRRASVVTPPGRRAIFVGDLVDRGPASPDVLRIVMAMVAEGSAWCVPGNHDHKFTRWLKGHNVKLTHGLQHTVEQMTGEAPAFHAACRAFFEALPSYLWLDRGGLVVAHAGIKRDMIGRPNGEVRHFCLFGDTAGTQDEFGLTIRYHWAAEYDGTASVVYGHTPVSDAAWFNRTLCIDTGCVYGGRLTALRWPEREISAVPARATYAERRRPFGHPEPRPGAVLAVRGAD